MARIAQSFDIEQSSTGPRILVSATGAVDVTRDPFVNKGSAFTEKERIELGLDGRLPPEVATLEEQVKRQFGFLSREPNDLAKYQYLRHLQDRNETLFYAVLSEHVEELLPIVYTPTVGEAIAQYSRLYRAPRGLTFSLKNIGRAKQILASYPLEDIRMIVATDSSAILGIGDQGYGGIAISIGKLALYTLGGLPPYHALPVSLDVGTDREELLEDRNYLGVREKRLRGDAYFALMDQFVEAVRERFPAAMLQWEDFSKDTAFDVLARYRDKQPSFNDDIQGTGAVALAGLMRAAAMTKIPFVEQVFLLHGAGAGGAGVAAAICAGLVRAGLSEEQAKARVFVLDSKGLLLEDRAMEPYKRKFAQPVARIAGWQIQGAIPTLHETIKHAKVTALIGLSGQSGTFDRDAIRAVELNADRPIVFPLSNPTANTEVLPVDVLEWTKGAAVVATGSPFAPVVLSDDSVRVVGQGNNAFVFPGIGLGALIAGARSVTDDMVLTAAYTLAAYTEANHPTLLYPPTRELREVAVRVAAAVAKKALEQGVAAEASVLGAISGNMEDYVRARAYVPRYLPVALG